MLSVFLIWIWDKPVFAQERPDLSKYTSSTEKLEAWRLYCNELLRQSELTTKLISEAKFGLSMCKAGDIKNQAMFSLFTGCAYEKSLKYDSAVYFLERTVTLARKINKTSYQITALSRLAYVYHYVSDVPKQKSTLNRMVKIADTSKDLNVKSLTATALGGYYYDIDDYEKSIQYRLQEVELYKQLLKVDTATTDVANLGYSLSNIAAMYNNLSREKKAIEYLDEARIYIGKNILRNGEETLYRNYLMSYLGLNNIDSAKAYYQRIYKEMGKDSLYSLLTYANQQMGEYYFDHDKVDLAAHYVKLALRYAKNAAQVDPVVESELLFGKVLYKQKKYSEAIRALNSALGENSYEFDKASLASIYVHLAKSYAALNQWDKAYSHLEKYSLLNDTLKIAAANKNFNEIEGKYQNTQKLQQIRLKNLELNKGKTERLWLIAGLLLMIAVISLLAIIYRNKKKTADVLDEKNRALAKLNNDLEVANQTKAKLFSIISHDLRSPISQVYQYLKLQQHNPQLHTEEQKSQLSSNIQEATGTLLETMEDLLLWSKTQMNHFNPSFEKIEILPLVEQCQQLLKLNSDSKNIVVKNNLNASTSVTTDPYFLQIIVRNLLQNAIKAAPEYSTIEIDSEQQNDQVRLQITNQGKMFGQKEYESLLKNENIDKGLSGLGLKLVDELALKLGLSVRFVDTRGSIITAEILFPKN
ncbi:HAMP domain-containing sensor histidine kinase [Pedobacter foliorum]|uniref:tetratricopeptide repeat-containing sensor histidine kinase n=1 Tax=Pedobacter foliorum TaxID=2739058 RepID=UPI001564E872|nr:HAMP domain-containing sensor histidine kinase [Pedobacter foliorum]NRF39466.1 GHKL domain-containing protein [Pedobacter foliorum]